MGLDNPLHIAFLLIVLLLVFGAKRLPELGSSLGSGMRGFKDALSGEGTPTSTLTAAAASDSPGSEERSHQPAERTIA
jgi:sec-independent protein translocase protein TatA